MSDEYKELYERARELASELRERITNSDAPLASQLKEDAEHLKEFMEGGGKPEKAAYMAKDLAKLLSRVADQPEGQSPMKSGDADELHEQYMELREDLEDVEA